MTPEDRKSRQAGRDGDAPAATPSLDGLSIEDAIAAIVAEDRAARHADETEPQPESGAQKAPARSQPMTDSQRRFRALFEEEEPEAAEDEPVVREPEPAQGAGKSGAAAPPDTAEPEPRGKGLLSGLVGGILGFGRGSARKSAEDNATRSSDGDDLSSEKQSQDDADLLARVMEANPEEDAEASAEPSAEAPAHDNAVTPDTLPIAEQDAPPIVEETVEPPPETEPDEPFFESASVASEPTAEKIPEPAAPAIAPELPTSATSGPDEAKAVEDEAPTPEDSEEEPDFSWRLLLESGGASLESESEGREENATPGAGAAAGQSPEPPAAPPTLRVVEAQQEPPAPEPAGPDGVEGEVHETPADAGLSAPAKEIRTAEEGSGPEREGDQGSLDAAFEVPESPGHVAPEEMPLPGPQDRGTGEGDDAAARAVESPDEEGVREAGGEACREAAVPEPESVSAPVTAEDRFAPEPPSVETELRASDEDEAVLAAPAGSDALDASDTGAGQTTVEPEAYVEAAGDMGTTGPEAEKPLPTSGPPISTEAEPETEEPSWTAAPPPDASSDTSTSPPPAPLTSAAPDETEGPTRAGSEQPDFQAFAEAGELPTAELEPQDADDTSDAAAVRHDVAIPAEAHADQPQEVAEPQASTASEASTALVPATGKAAQGRLRQPAEVWPEVDPLADLVAKTVAAEVTKPISAKDERRRVKADDQLGADMTAPMAMAGLPILLAVPLLALGGIAGGAFALIALIYLVAVSLGPEDLFARVAEAAEEGDRRERAERAGAALSALHFPVFAFALFALGGKSGLSFGEWCAMFAAFALYFGQVSLTAAHELIHSRRRKRQNLGLAVHVSLLCGPYARIHRLIHHRFAATPFDPMTAEVDEGFWNFATRSWSEGLVAGWEIEQVLMKPRLGRKRATLHPYFVLIGAGAGVVLAAGIVFGLGAALALLLLAAVVRAGVMIGDYVRHYGMQRQKLDSDRFESLGPRHEWVPPRILPAALRPRQPWPSDHEAHPVPASRSDEAEAPGGASPTLPAPMPLVALVALLPPIWRKLMRRRMQAVAQKRPSTSLRAARTATGADGA
ncbi:fatty acid desaturase [Ostreiculturibacter nitratireducens]|uniref:fatty acid desaturase n=1 Tax=Ostreiculturibacter nitratireducens TaxID=3075226 RepID=UPI0031B61D14